MGARLRTACVVKLLPLLLLLAVPAAVQAQWNYKTSSGTITITGYTGPGGAVTIPDTIHGLPVTCIGNWAFGDCLSLTNVTIPNSITAIEDYAFFACTSLTSVTIPNSVTSIGNYTFWECYALTSVTIPNSVTNIGNWAFDDCVGLTCVTIPNSVTSIGDRVFCACDGLTNVTIPNSVTSLGDWAFLGCTSLASVTIPSSVTSIGDKAFDDCTSLVSLYFQGNAPSVGGASSENVSATVYYLPGTTGWGTTVLGLPTALWSLPTPVILNNGPSFGVQTNRFGFIISWATNISVVVEASTNLANPVWSPVGTNTLTGGASYFSDPRWTNYPARFYRLRSP